MPRSLWRIGTLVAAAALAAGCAVDVDADGGLNLLFGEQTADEFSWSGRVATGGTVEIKGVNGAVRAEPAAGPIVEVVARRRGRWSDPADVRIEVVEHDGGVTLCAVYPTPPGELPNECRPGGGGRMKVRGNDVRVDFDVRVPDGVHFAGRTVNGAVSAGTLSGDVTVRTVNGSVRIETRGHADAKTVNGSIDASVGRADWTGSAEFETVNGSITLDLPGETHADVRARTTNGRITSDFPLTVSGAISRRRLQGTIGRGGRELRLETVNGGIRLRRASAPAGR